LRLVSHDRFVKNHTLKISPCFKGIATSCYGFLSGLSGLKISPCFKGIATTNANNTAPTFND